jgi:DNA-binding transcriptional ArsR family regulator
MIPKPNRRFNDFRKRRRVVANDNDPSKGEYLRLAEAQDKISGLVLVTLKTGIKLSVDGRFFVVSAVFRQDAKITRKTVYNHLKKLTANGFIVKLERGQGTFPAYRLTSLAEWRRMLPKGAAEITAESEEITHQLSKACVACGSAMTLNGGKYACSANRERGTCSNGKIIAAERVERRVVEGIRTKLLSPEAIAKAVQDHRDAAAVERREILASRAPIERELTEIARKIERGQEMCLNEVISIADLKALTAKHATRRQELESKLASLEQPTDVAAHPGAAAAYARLAERLSYAMERGRRRGRGRPRGVAGADRARGFRAGGRARQVQAEYPRKASGPARGFREGRCCLTV